MLASASHDRSVKLWTLPEGAPVWTLLGHGAPVYAVAFATRRGTALLASCDAARDLWLWDASRGAPVHRLRLNHVPRDLKFNDFLLLVGHLQGASVFQINTCNNTGNANATNSVGGGSCECTLVAEYCCGSNRQTICVDFIPEPGADELAELGISSATEHDKTLCLIALDDEALIWNYSCDKTPNANTSKTSAVRQKMRMPGGERISACAAISASRLLLGSCRTLSQWRPHRIDVAVRSHDAHDSNVSDIRIARAANLIATSCFNRTLKLWDLHAFD